MGKIQFLLTILVVAILYTIDERARHRRNHPLYGVPWVELPIFNQ